jgi:hypothetical protein
MDCFTAQYGGDYDIYVMPSGGGGEPKRLTYYPGYDEVLGWTPDSKRVLFYSRRASVIHPINKLFTVGLEGGFPKHCRFPIPGLRLSRRTERSSPTIASRLNIVSETLSRRQTIVCFALRFESQQIRRNSAYRRSRPFAYVVWQRDLFCFRPRRHNESLSL